MIYQLGQESCLVGRSSACDYPEKVKDLPAAGNMGIPFMEKLASLKPDYVFVSGFRDKRVKKAIEELGIKVIVVPGETLSDYTAG
jgi:iron complex transport system substrate-binding protein